MGSLRLKWVAAFVCALGVRAGADDLVTSSELGQIGYYKYWQASLPLQALDEDQEWIEKLYRVDDRIYAVSNLSVVYAIDGKVGTIRWAVQVTGPGHQVYRPTHVRSFYGRNLTLISTSEKIRWLDRESGEVVFEMDPGLDPSSAAISDGVRVYFHSLDRMLHCFEFTRIDDDKVAPFQKWRVAAGAVNQSTPVLWGPGLFFASENGRIYACDLRNKERLWVFRSGGANKAGLHVDSTGVYFGSTDRKIYKLDVFTGRGVWQYQTPGVISQKPIIIGDQLYQSVEGHGIYMLHTDSGRLVWALTTATDFVAANGTHTYLLTDYGDIVALEPGSGSVKAQVYAGAVELVAPNSMDSAMYFASRDGTVMCARAKSVPYLRYEAIQAAGQDSTAASEPDSEGAAQGSSRPSLRELLRSKSDTPALGG